MQRSQYITPAHPSAFTIAPHLLPCWHKFQQLRKQLRRNSGKMSLRASPLSASLSASQLFNSSDQSNQSNHSNQSDQRLDPSLLQGVHMYVADDGNESFVPGKKVPSLSSSMFSFEYGIPDTVYSNYVSR
jgi:hypothetical protein